MMRVFGPVKRADLIVAADGEDAAIFDRDGLCVW